MNLDLDISLLFKTTDREDGVNTMALGVSPLLPLPRHGREPNSQGKPALHHVLHWVCIKIPVAPAHVA